jgi:hypothetical protein
MVTPSDPGVWIQMLFTYQRPTRLVSSAKRASERSASNEQV